MRNYTSITSNSLINYTLLCEEDKYFIGNTDSKPMWDIKFTYLIYLNTYIYEK